MTVPSEEVTLTSPNNIHKKPNSDFNVKCNAVKLLKENTEKYIYNFGIGKDFLNSTHTKKMFTIWEKMDKLACIKIKNLIIERHH